MLGAAHEPGAVALLDALRWPNIVGKRCLVLGRCAGEVTAALEARRAESVVTGDGAPPADAADEPFDLTVGWGVVSDAAAPLDRLQDVWRATRGIFVSIEPIDALLTVGGRPLPLLRLGPGGDGPRWSLNGRAHHRLLTAAGFVVERPSGILAVPPPSPSAGRVERLLGRVLTGARAGTPHRALIGRVSP